MAKCNDSNGTLPLLDNMEDMKLFSHETGYMNIVYLGATSNQNPNSYDRYLWTDLSHFQFLADLAPQYAPNVDIYTTDTADVKRITFPYVDGSGKCVALIYFPHVMSRRVVSIPCDVQLNVSVYCSAMVTQNAPVYNTILSTIHIGFAENNFRTIGREQYCLKDVDYDDYGDLNPLRWFQQHEICLQMHHCIANCDVLTEVCKPHQLYFFPYYDAHSLTIKNNSHIAKFLSTFQEKLINKGTGLDRFLTGLIRRGYIPMFYSNVSDVNQSVSNFSGSFLRVWARQSYEGLWAHDGTVQILTSTKTRSPKNTFVLCTKDPLPPDQPTCSSTYFQCNDGTCLDEHLVCDGRQHCMVGEDEQKCGNICTDKVSCALSCSYMTNCHCLRGFFQCVTGGCIPVGKLCDRVKNCKDGSDEPMSCEFASAQTQRSILENHWNILRQRCSQGSGSKVFLVNPFDLTPSEVIHYNTEGDGRNDFYYDLGIRFFICFDEDPDTDLSEQAPRYFLDRWCLYSYSYFADIGYAHFPCANGYHLAGCEKMYCIDTFKCIRSYCLEWKYVCDSSCDCPHCEDESICENVSCPGMILHESAHGKVYCNEEADNRLAAVLIQSSSYDLHIHAQSEMCAQVLNCSGSITTRNNIVYLDLLHGNHLGHVTCHSGNDGVSHLL